MLHNHNAYPNHKSYSSLWPPCSHSNDNIGSQINQRRRYDDGGDAKRPADSLYVSRDNGD